MLGVLGSGVPLVSDLTERGHPVTALFLGFLLVLVGHSSWVAWRAIRDRGDPRRFYGVGLLAAWGSVRSWQRWRGGQAAANWWVREHYGAILGNGVATHIAFLSIGLRNTLPFIDPQLRTQLAWLVPLAVAMVAGIHLDRRYGRGVAARRVIAGAREPSGARTTASQLGGV
jgi:hypothetical protein